MARYKTSKYKSGYFCGGIHIYFNLVIYEDKFYIPLIIQSFALHRYHMYILNPEMYIMERFIHQNIYCHVIRESIQKGGINAILSDVQNCKIKTYLE